MRPTSWTKKEVDTFLGNMKTKRKSRNIIVESLKEDGTNETSSLLDEKNILNSNN